MFLLIINCKIFRHHRYATRPALLFRPSMHQMLTVLLTGLCEVQKMDTGKVERIRSAQDLVFARSHVPDPKAERNALIAATALVHNMSVATRSGADFASTGVPIVNPR